MKSAYSQIIFLTLAIGLFYQDGYAALKNRVLVLHSYHQGLEWTDNITRGIQSVFIPYQKQYEIHYEYLDTKRNSSQAYMEQMVNFISAKNRDNQYQVVIVSDNTALKLLNQGRIKFSGNPQVVFCGINNYHPNLTDGLDSVTGVVENADHRATIELMQKLHPERNQITVIVDRTPTGEAIKHELKEIEASYNERVNFVFLRDFLLDEIQDKLARLDDKSLIYLTTFNRDRNNNFISYADAIEVISRSTSVPIYGVWDFYLGKGIVGGRITSGYHQGQEAGKLALKLLAGQQASDLQVVASSPNQYMFDYRYIKLHGIDSSLLPNGSQLINTPQDLYTRYRVFLVGITIVSFFCVLVVLWKYKKQQITLRREQMIAAQLEKKVKERTLELERVNKELQRLSDVDGLSQIYNRRYFDNALVREIHRQQRSSTTLSLLMCDIDCFKCYNDAYGHLAGDDCIRLVAKTILKQCRRTSDIAARYGGEEFSVILPNTNSNGALLIAESIRHGVEQLKIPHKRSPVKESVTLSIGIASLIPDLHTTPSTIIALADKALYESKLNGRNQVTLNRINPNVSSGRLENN
jgi:diguanylate cyclase (GGDEF)-like protein